MNPQAEKDKKKVIKLVNKKKNYFFYKNYSLYQSIIRYYSVLVRNPLSKKYTSKKIFLQFSFRIIIFLTRPLILKIIPRKIDGIISVNTKYKMNLIEKIFENSGIKIGILTKDFSFKIPGKFYKIPKFLFINKNLENSDFFLINELNIYENIYNFYNPKFSFSLEGDSYVDTLISEISKKRKIPHYCLQHGINHPFIINKNLKYEFKKYFYNFIYLSRSITHVNFLRQKGLVKKFEIFKKKNKNINKNKKKNIIFCFSPLFEGTDNKSIIKAINFANETARNYPNIKIFIRPHPNGSVDQLINKNLDGNENLVVDSANEVSLESAFKDCLVAIFFNGSSTIIDAIQNNTIPIIHNDNKWYNLSYLKKRKIALLPSNLKKCKLFLDQILKKEKLRNSYLKNIYKFNFSNSSYKNSKSIITIIKKKIK